MTTHKRIILYPGELAIVKNNEEIWTILGSCISIVLHSRKAHISAINHAQLPAQPVNAKCKNDCPSPCGQTEMSDYKFVTCSFDYMWHELMKMGITPQELEVSLYGGATSEHMKGSPYSVGSKNIEAAESCILSHSLRITHRDVGGCESRKLIHMSETGLTQINSRSMITGVQFPEPKKMELR